MRQRSVRFRGWWSMLLCVALLAASTLVPAVAAYAQSGPQLTVVTPVLNVRSGPGTSYAVIDVLRTGETVGVVGRSTAGGWWQVALAGGASGWVSGAQGLVSVRGDVSAVPEAAAPAAPAPTAAPAAQSRTGEGIVVFQLSSGGPIYVANADGTGVRQLTSGIDPALSPDGKQVAFTRWQGNSTGALGQVFVINVDGSGEHAVLSDVHQPKAPAWSPDGTQLIISYQQGGFTDYKRICSSQPPQTNAFDITESTDSKGKKTYCYTSPPDPGWGLRVINLQTGASQDTAHDLHSYSPTWDPANAWHVVYTGDGGLKNLDLNRQAIWPLTNDGNDRSPAFSPDGKRIATMYNQNDHWAVCVMNADGSGRDCLTPTQGASAANNVAPAWSPDGAQIAFLSDRGGSWQLWAMNADGSNQRLMLGTSNLSFQYNFVDERVVSWR